MNKIEVIINAPTIILFTLTLLSLGASLFFIGYFYAHKSLHGVSYVKENRPTSFFKKEEKNSTSSAVAIDDRKFVIDIKTDNLEKKYDQLGEVKQSNENISNSINKLKNMKR